MQVTDRDLIDSFGALSDEAIAQRLRAGTLTEQASRIAIAELTRRGVEIPADPTGSGPEQPAAYSEKESRLSRSGSSATTCPLFVGR